MEKRTFNNLKSSETKPQSIVKIGHNTLAFIDKDIVQKLKISEDDCCTQAITEDGAIILRIKKISGGGQNASI